MNQSICKTQRTTVLTVTNVCRLSHRSAFPGCRVWNHVLISPRVSVKAEFSSPYQRDIASSENARHHNRNFETMSEEQASVIEVRNLDDEQRPEPLRHIDRAEANMIPGVALVFVEDAKVFAFKLCLSFAEAGALEDLP